MQLILYVAAHASDTISSPTVSAITFLTLKSVQTLLPFSSVIAASPAFAANYSSFISLTVARMCFRIESCVKLYSFIFILTIIFINDLNFILRSMIHFDQINQFINKLD